MFGVCGAISGCSLTPFGRSFQNFDKRHVFQKKNVVVESMGCRGGGANLDKRNLFDKRNVVVESMGCRGGGKILIKGMLFKKGML